MSTYTQIIYQIVFSPKHRDPTLVGVDARTLLFKYIWGVLKNNKCILYKINGVENHIHILTHLHPGTSLSSLVKDIKVSTSIWIKKQHIFPGFEGWGVGYGAFTYTIKERRALENYIENQVTHHLQTSFLQEYQELLKKHKIKFDSQFLT